MIWGGGEEEYFLMMDLTAKSLICPTGGAHPSLESFEPDLFVLTHEDTSNDLPCVASAPFRHAISSGARARGTAKGNANEVDLIAATSAMRIWSMKTRHPLEAVLNKGFFDGMVDLRFKRDDRIDLISNCYADRSEQKLRTAL